MVASLLCSAPLCSANKSSDYTPAPSQEVRFQFITGAAEAVPGELGNHQLGVTPDTSVSPPGAARLPAGISSPCSNGPQEAWSLVCWALVTVLPGVSRSAVLLGTRASVTTDAEAVPWSAAVKADLPPPHTPGPSCGVQGQGRGLAGSPRVLNISHQRRPRLGPPGIRVSHDQTGIQMGSGIKR